MVLSARRTIDEPALPARWAGSRPCATCREGAQDLRSCPSRH
jgi:hypothetical protein